MKNKLKKNVKKNYLFVVLSRFDLTQGMWMLYLASKGLSLFQIGIMETIYHLSSFSMEIPTGAIADIYGRKTSRILGRIAAVVSTLIMIFGGNVFAFAVSFVFAALSNNLESGAGDALVYDSLKELGEDETYMKISGRNELFYQITRTLSLLIGGYIATTSYAMVYKFAFAAAVISVLQALSFTEPTIGKVEKKESLWLTFSHQIISSFKAMFGNKQLVEMIIALELFSTLYVTEFFYIQNYLKMQGKTELQIGIVLAFGAGVAAVMATQTYKLEARFKMKGILTFVSFLAILGFWGMTIEGIEPYAFFLLGGAEGVMFVSMGDYINKRIPSEKRATILSLQSMIFSLFMIILFPVIGYIGDLVGLGKAFMLIAVISTLVLGGFIKLARRA